MTAFFEPGNLADALLVFGASSSGAMPTLPPGMVGKLKVKTRHLGYKKQIKRVGTTSARNTKFPCDDPAAGLKGEVSVEEFFFKSKRSTFVLMAAAVLTYIYFQNTRSNSSTQPNSPLSTSPAQRSLSPFGFPLSCATSSPDSRMGSLMISRQPK